ncbi:MAG: cation:proton antiporter, partial [Paramuribaculum sp.]|nr:cation:proton antiporter [Paramuribaculum sp.]
EIDMYHLKKNIRRGLIFGLYTFFVPVIMGCLGGVYLLGLDWLTASMLAAMLAAHTLLAYPIVSRFGLTKNPAVVIAIAGTIFAVLGSLIMLASVVGIEKAGEFDFILVGRLLLRVLGVCGVITYVYPRVTRWFFKHFNDGIMQFVYVLVMVFTAAELAELGGIEGVFGAFFAALVLNRYIPGRSPLMSRIEFVGNAIFIPYFLIGVGMLIDVKLITQGWNTLYVTAVMCAVAMAAKWVAAWLAQLTFGMKSLERSILYQLSNAHTAVALAVVMIGFQMGLFSQSILNGTVLMILVTCTVSSIGTSRAAAKLKVLTIQKPENVGSKSAGKEPLRTLIPVVNPAGASELVNLALMMNDGRKERNKIYALHVRNDNSLSSRSVGQNSLDTARRIGSIMDVDIRTIERFDLNFVTGLLNTIAERDINEVVIGLHRRSNVIDSFFGEKLTQLIKATYKMIVISRCFIPINTIRRIVVSVPDKAQYETGFTHWVRSIGNLTRQLGCRVVFCATEETAKYIKAVLRTGGYEIRQEYIVFNDWDDFVLLANKIKDDDLLVVVNARRTSVSFNSAMDTLPDFLRKYFAGNNLLVIFPEQFGQETLSPAITDALSADVETLPIPLWLKVRHAYLDFIHHRRRKRKSGKSPDLNL